MTESQPAFVSQLRGEFTESIENLLRAGVFEHFGVSTEGVVDAALRAFDSVPVDVSDVAGYAKLALETGISVVRPVIDAVGERVAARQAEIDRLVKRQQEFDEFCRMRTSTTVQ